MLNLWHDAKEYSPSIGCFACPDRHACGGLNLGVPFYDCLGFCCNKPETCDAVCRYKPKEFVQRIREVGGWQFDNVPRASQLLAPQLPAVIPLIYHGNRRQTPFSAQTVCLPLYRVISRRNGERRFASAEELVSTFRIDAQATIILNGIDQDPPLERWWSLGEKRLEIIRALRELGIKLVTTPNYSLFVDQPRWDDLHSMKRIAIVHEEFLRENLPAALHLNARTETDWNRWAQFISQREEITHIAFEYTTGAGRAGRMDWHTNQLTKLAELSKRSLHLIVRAAVPRTLIKLRSAFGGVSTVDTTTFFKTVNRQRALMKGKCKVEWDPAPTAPSRPLDDLLEHNWQIQKSAWDPSSDADGGF